MSAIAWRTRIAARRSAPSDVEHDLAEVLVRLLMACLLYTSDAADERSSVDLGGRRIIKKKKTTKQSVRHNDIDK